MNVTRRDMIRAGSASFAVALAPSALHAQQNALLPLIQTVLGEGLAFDPANVVELARNLARRPYQPPATGDLPEPFSALTAEQYAGIKSPPASWLWSGESVGFAIEPLHRGLVFTNPVSLFTVEDGAIRRIGYDPARFEFGAIARPQRSPDIGFSGFRVFSDALRFDISDPPREAAVFQGANFFRGTGRGQNAGVVARGLTLRPAEIRGEEFPAFRAFWIERPTVARNALVVHALLDSESSTGAYRFTIRPGEVTQMDVEASVFARVQLDHYGLAGMTSTFLHGGVSRRLGDDIRPAVHESNGLQMLTGTGEWIWRPLANPETLQISVFMDRNPRGFGLLQRERDAAAFDDDDQQFERKPALWVEPIGDWGEGAVQLLEIPSDSDLNDNILAYWRPKVPVAAGSATSFAYRLHWCWSPPDMPPLLTAQRARSGRGGPGRRRRFSIEFAGEALGDPAYVAGLQPLVRTASGGVGNVRTRLRPDRRSYRLQFELEPGTEQMAELRVQILNQGRPVSETWLYRWTP